MGRILPFFGVGLISLTLCWTLFRCVFLVYRWVYGDELTRLAHNIHLLILQLFTTVPLLTLSMSSSDRPTQVLGCIAACVALFATWTFSLMYRHYQETSQPHAAREEQDLDGTRIHHIGQRAWWFHLALLLTPTGLGVLLMGLLWARKPDRTVVLKANQLALVHGGQRRVFPLLGLTITEQMSPDGTPMLFLQHPDAEDVRWPLGGMPTPDRQRLLVRIREAIGNAKVLGTREAKQAMARSGLGQWIDE